MDVSDGDHVTNDHRHGFLGREALDLGALLLAAGASHVVVLSLGHSDGGVRTLIGVGLLLLAVSALHRWHRHRAAHAPRRRGPRADASGSGAGDAAGTGPEAGAGPAPTGGAATDGGSVRDGGAGAGTAPYAAHDPADDRLWGVRVTVADVPGGLAALTARFAALGVDIRLMQVHPAGTDAVDEFFVSAPVHVGEESLHTAVREAGGRDALVRPADVHELSDTTSRTLALVSALIAGSATLERSLLALTAAHEVEHADSPPDGLGREDLSGASMTLPAPDGGVLTVRRNGVPFTAVEFARCRALVQVASSLHARTRRG
ncbi:ACT domain-containing protein [Nocardiopsis tropica]|uniref:ACT domain-containing protein n=1 Tax=Nocardiopsis tropica TaxID=109330 RepID=A0ABU7KUM7_9ACTN|nr:ACT domain-containing protein [Nocardiopsis umidischolae]MEE2052998.1 ACT domain-containing protein [Nocardiopsis umidischolae]